MCMTMMVGGRPWLVPVLIDPETDREAWVAARVAGIGGSDAAAVVGEHPHKRPIDVWGERCGGVTVEIDNERTRVGRLLEDTVIGWFAEGGDKWERPGGPYAIAKPPTVYHRDRPWQRGSADALIYEPEQAATIPDRGYPSLALSPLLPIAGGEVKTHGWMASRAYETEDDGVFVDVPADKRIQCAWYMELYDLPVWYLIALVDTHHRKTYVIERDRELGATLLEQVEAFWKRHVLTGDPPDSDGSRSYREYLSRRFSKHSTILVPSTPDIDAATELLISIKRTEKQAKDERERLEQLIKAHIGDAMGVETKLGAVTWKSQRSGKLRDKDARGELYKILGWTDAEILAFEKRYEQPDHRVMRTPK